MLAHNNFFDTNICTELGHINRKGITATCLSCSLVDIELYFCKKIQWAWAAKIIVCAGNLKPSYTDGQERYIKVHHFDGEGATEVQNIGGCIDFN